MTIYIVYLVCLPIFRAIGSVVFAPIALHTDTQTHRYTDTQTHTETAYFIY